MAEKKPYIAIILVETLYAGTTLLSKAAFNGGMNTFVFVFYRQTIATVLILPLALVFARNGAPPLSFKLMIKIFFLAMFGYALNINLHNIAIKLSSATVATAATNLIPVFTFILAVCLRQEMISLNSCPGIAKVFGVILCSTGAMILAFYRGPQLNPFIHHHPILHENNSTDTRTNKTSTIGTLLMILVAFFWALYTVLLGVISREYPSWIWTSTLICLFSSVQCFVVAIALERDMSNWKLHLDDGLVAVIFNGVAVAGLAAYLQIWCIHKKGPVFVAMFSPLQLVITIATSSFLLGEVINLESVLGGAFMVCGLYSVIWGKSKEGQELIKNSNEEPMLKNDSTNDDDV